MSLRIEAEKDLEMILEDAEGGFGWPITVINPQGIMLEMIGISGDIGQAIDPDTGQIVSGRLAYCTLRISSLVEGGFSLPEGITSSSSLPWRIRFDDIGGTEYTFKVFRSMPDRALGIVNLILEGWHD